MMQGTVAKPFSEACEENKAPILAVLEPLLRDSQSVLEIGSGSGQHAVYFGAQLPAVQWQPSDCAAYLPGIQQWLDEAGLANMQALIELDVLADAWPSGPYDAVFSANTAHIMSWPAVEAMFAGVGRVLRGGGAFCLYGPFAYQGRHTSVSNQRFDQWLRRRDPASGVRDLDDIIPLATAAGLALEQDIEMPVNNRSLVFRAGV